MNTQLNIESVDGGFLVSSGNYKKVFTAFEELVQYLAVKFEIKNVAVVTPHKIDQALMKHPDYNISSEAARDMIIADIME